MYTVQRTSFPSGSRNECGIQFMHICKWNANTKQEIQFGSSVSLVYGSVFEKHRVGWLVRSFAALTIIYFFDGWTLDQWTFGLQISSYIRIILISYRIASHQHSISSTRNFSILQMSCQFQFVGRAVLLCFTSIRFRKFTESNDKELQCVRHILDSVQVERIIWDGENVLGN